VFVSFNQIEKFNAINAHFFFCWIDLSAEFDEMIQRLL